VFLQMRCVMRPSLRLPHVRLQRHNGVEHIQALQLLVTILQE
jgi:hypothetical protein